MSGWGNAADAASGAGTGFDEMTGLPPGDRPEPSTTWVDRHDDGNFDLNRFTLIGCISAFGILPFFIPMLSAIRYGCSAGPWVATFSLFFVGTTFIYSIANTTDSDFFGLGLNRHALFGATTMFNITGIWTMFDVACSQSDIVNAPIINNHSIVLCSVTAGVFIFGLACFVLTILLGRMRGDDPKLNAGTGVAYGVGILLGGLSSGAAVSTGILHHLQTGTMGQEGSGLVLNENGPWVLYFVATAFVVLLSAYIIGGLIDKCSSGKFRLNPFC